MRHRTVTVAGLLAGTLLLAACGEANDTDTAAPDTTGSGASSGPSSGSSSAADFTDADVAFVTGMRPHHAQAVAMSDMILAADPIPEVAALAERVKAAQTPEIQQLDEMLEHFGVEDAADGPHGAHGGGDGATALHGGMMTDEQMAGLAAATGTEASRRWLEMMIEHHEGAVEAADRELAEGTYPPALELARSISASQAAEIGEMEQLLTGL